MAINYPNAPSKLGLDNFVSSLDKMGGIAKLARFAVQIRPIGTDNALTSYNSVLPDMIYACFQTEFPGRGFNTFSTRYYGPEQVYPYNTKYGTADFTFICRNNSIERKLFDDWQDAINPTSNFNFAYPSKYYCDIVMYQFSEIGIAANEKEDAGASTINYAWTLRKAWPSLVKPQAVTWMDTDFLFLQVEFTYKYWDRSTSIGEETSVVLPLQTQL